MSEVDRQTDCMDQLTDGSSRASLCHWFANYPSTSILMLRPIRDALDHEVDSLRNADPFNTAFTSCLSLDRTTQGTNKEFQTLLKDKVLPAASRLAYHWSQLLSCSADTAPESPLRVQLVRALLRDLSVPGDREDTLICDEIQHGCNIGMRYPISPLRLWPPDQGPKHSGFSLDLWSAQP